MDVYQETDDALDLDSYCDVMSELGSSHDDTALTGIRYNDISLQEERFKKVNLKAHEHPHNMYSYSFNFSIVPFHRCDTTLERSAERRFSSCVAFTRCENHNKVLSNRPECRGTANGYDTGIELSCCAIDVSNTFSPTCLCASSFNYFTDTNAPNAQRAYRNDLLAPRSNDSVFCMTEQVEYVNKNNQRFFRKMSDAERRFIPRKLRLDV